MKHTIIFNIFLLLVISQVSHAAINIVEVINNTKYMLCITDYGSMGRGTIKCKKLVNLQSERKERVKEGNGNFRYHLKPYMKGFFSGLEVPFLYRNQIERSRQIDGLHFQFLRYNEKREPKRSFLVLFQWEDYRDSVLEKLYQLPKGTKSEWINKKDLPDGDYAIEFTPVIDLFIEDHLYPTQKGFFRHIDINNLEIKLKLIKKEED